MNRHWPSRFIFWLSLFAFTAIDVKYANVMFNTTTRWAFLGALSVVLIIEGQFLSSLRGRFGATLTCYLLWCLSTTLWSELPLLSLMKGGAFVLTTLAFVGGGQRWAKSWNSDNPISYLIPIEILVLFAGLSGSQPTTTFGSIELYQGLTANSNELGVLTAIAIPFALYQVCRIDREKSRQGKLLISYGLLGALLLVLWLSASRASIVCVLVTLMIFILTFRMSRVVTTLMIIGFIGAGVAITTPEVEHSISDRLIYKGHFSDDGSIFFSRQQVWSESYEQAVKGGWFGGGYGVTIGDMEFSGGLTAQNYGREKGNSQLAIWEETGLVGLALYALLIALIIKESISGLTAIRDDRIRAQIGLLSGLMLGLLAQSVFEAWWTAPGSAESAVFWATCGVILGMQQQAGLSQQSVSRSSRRALAFVRAAN